MLKLNFSPFPTLETAHLVLRQVAKEDVKELFFLRSDKDVLTYLDKDPARSIEEVAKFIEGLHELEKDHKAINWAITLKEEPKMIGTICLWNIVPAHYRAEIGYALHPDHHGKSIMQEAVAAVLNYGFKIMKLHSIEANVNPNNASSIKLLERNNFVKEAHFKENYFYNGKFLDSVIYSLLSPIPFS
jgi:[ribosomal protein S5]-alanine N-acetyltransferase